MLPLPLDARDLGAALHGEAFRGLLNETFSESNEVGMGKKVERKKCNIAAILALKLFGEALSVDCGQRALSFFPQLISTVVPFLFFPEEHVAAMEVIFRMCFVASTIPYLREHALSAVMHVW